jgi:hypothetical protein
VAAEELLRAWVPELEVEIEAFLHGEAPGGSDRDRAAGATPEASTLGGSEPDGEFWATPGVTPSSAPPRVVPPDEATLALQGAVEAVAAVSPSSLSPEQALARTKALQVIRQQLDIVTLEAISDVDKRKLFTLDDQPSTPAWVKAQQVPGASSSDVTLARRLRDVPKVAEELRAGRMSTTTGTRLSAFMAKARPHLDRPDGRIDGLDGEAVLYGVAVDGVCSKIAEQIGAASTAEQDLAELRETLEEIVDAGGSQAERLEAALVVFARRCDTALLPSGLALLLDALLPLQHQKRADKADAERDFSLVRKGLGSGWYCKGDLSDETGEMLATALDAAAVTDPDSPNDTTAWREGRDAVGDDTLGPEDWPAEQPRPRTRGQKRHDALKLALRALLGSGALGTRGKVFPHVGVTVGLDFLHGVPGSLPGVTAHGARLARQQVRELLCRSTFTRLVLDATSRVVDISHTQRTSTALERLILGVQCGGVCQRKGCCNGPATGHRLIPHHGGLFSNTGVTALEDIAMVCEIDHDHELHGKGRTIELKDGRVLGPNGWVRR